MKKIIMPSPDSCPVCRAHQGNTRHLYMIETEIGRHVVDVSKAMALVADGRSEHFLEPGLVERLLAVNAPWVEEHIDHVDPFEPGLVGQLFGGLVLLDGTYQALRAQRQRRAFYAYILTFDETMSCLVNEPSMTPMLALQEVREMLRSNPGQPMEIDLNLNDISGDNSPQRMEAVIRSNLSKPDNERLRLVFHYQGRVLK